MRFSLYWCTVVSVFKRRLRLELFFSRIWLCPLLRRLSLPFFVTSKRPAAPLWVFIFGISLIFLRVFLMYKQNEDRGTGVAGSPPNIHRRSRVTGLYTCTKYIRQNFGRHCIKELR